MKTAYCDFIAGSFAGVCGTLVGHPLDTIKTWQQATNSGIGAAIYKIGVSHSGLKIVTGFYRGMLFPMFTTGGINSILFGIYGNQLRGLQKVCHSDHQREKYWMSHVFIAGSTAGFVQSFIACPIELIKIRLQTWSYYSDFRRGQKRGPWACLLRVVKNEGFRGLYRGIGPMICRDVFPYGIYMLAYEEVMRAFNRLPLVQELREEKARNPTKSMTGIDMTLTTIAGSIAGLLSWVLVIPFDTIKTIMQAEADPSRYKGMKNCVQSSIQRNGYRVLFRGSWILIFRAIPVNAITFLAYEYALDRCHKYYDIQIYPNYN